MKRYIRSNIQMLWPFRMYGEYEDGYSTTVGGNDEDDCIDRLIQMSDKHGDLTFYTGVDDELYDNGERIDDIDASTSAQARRGSTEIKASDLGRYVGSRLLTNWTASLLVYGAEESEDYDFEESFSGDFNEALAHLQEYQQIIDDNNIDGYLSLESDNSLYYQGDFDSICEELENDGLLATADLYD